jgi:hypothetical protein
MGKGMLRAHTLVAGSAFAIAIAACGGGSDVFIGAGPAPDGGGTADVVTGEAQAADAGGHDGTTGGGPDGSGTDATGNDGPATGEGSAESGVGGDAGFDPGSVSGLVLWLEASKGVTQTAGAVSGWADQTGNHNDASQSTATAQPTFQAAGIHGLPALHFDTDAVGMGNTGTGDLLTIGDATSLQWGTGDFYVAVVADFDNTFADGDETGTGFIFSKAGSSGPAPLLTANIIGDITQTNQVGLACSTSTTAGDWVLTNTPYNNGTPHVFAMQRASAVLDLRVDGVSVGTSTSTDDDVSSAGAPVTIGAGAAGVIARLDGDIAEILAVEGPLGTADRDAIESYLLTKYGL